MYNFFANRTHKRAFVKALKEVEREGYYVSGDTSEDMVFTTNMSRAVAALSDDQIPIRPVKDKTLDISVLANGAESKPAVTPSKIEIVEIKPKETHDDIQENIEATPRVKPADTNIVESKVYTRQSRAQMYEKMFSDDALLSGEHIKERGLLTSETSDDDIIDYRKHFASKNVMVDNKSTQASEESKKRTKKYLAELNAKVLKQREEEAKKAAEIKAEEQEALKETLAVEPEIEEPNVEESKIEESVVEEVVAEEPVVEEVIEKAAPEIVEAVPAAQEKVVELASETPVDESAIEEQHIEETVVEPAFEEPIVEEVGGSIGKYKMQSEPIKPAKTAKTAVKPKVVSAPEKVAKPKTIRTRKKRRRYDADIAGGFDF